MFVFTFVARLFKFQYERPHFDALLRLPPNRARTHIESPVVSGHQNNHVANSTTKKLLCVVLSLRFHNGGNSSQGRDTRRVNPPNLPLRMGKPPPFLPLLLTQQQAVYKKGSPRSSSPRPSQGRSNSSTRDRTSLRCHGDHRTGQHPVVRY